MDESTDTASSITADITSTTTTVHQSQTSQNTNSSFQTSAEDTVTKISTSPSRGTTKSAPRSRAAELLRRLLELRYPWRRRRCAVGARREQRQCALLLRPRPHPCRPQRLAAAAVAIARRTMTSDHKNCGFAVSVGALMTDSVDWINSKRAGATYWSVERLGRCCQAVIRPALMVPLFLNFDP